MAIVIPDLFGAFQKGREYAIDRNWKDLENYETIEKMRTANDMAQLALLQERYYTPLKMSMFGDNADNSAMQNQIQFTAYPGALSRARQYTNQAVSDEGVQRATLSDTAQTQIGKTLSDNAMVRGQSAFNASQAKNTEWGKNGAIAAAMTNYKAGKALSNAEWEQVLFELQAEAQKGTLGQTIFMNGVNKKNRPLIEQLTTQVLNNDSASAQKTFEQIMKGEQGTGSSGQAIKFVNPAYKDYTNEDIGALIDKHNAIVNNPNTTEASKAVSRDIIRAGKKELADRGVDITNGNQATGWGNASISNYNPYNKPGNLTFDYRPRDEQGRLLFDYGAGFVGQGQPGVGILVNPPNYTGFVGNNNSLGIDLSRYTDPANFATSTQDLSGGGQPPQTQATNLVGGDINTYLESVENDSSLSEPLRKAKLSAGALERDSSLFNNWGGVFGETDQPARNILVNGVKTPISNKTLDMLNSLNDRALSSNQLLIKKALLDNKAIQKTYKNGKVEFVPNQFIPMPPAGVNPVSPNYGFNRQWYRW